MDSGQRWGMSWLLHRHCCFQSSLACRPPARPNAPSRVPPPPPHLHQVAVVGRPAVLTAVLVQQPLQQGRLLPQVRPGQRALHPSVGQRAGRLAGGGGGDGGGSMHCTGPTPLADSRAAAAGTRLQHGSVDARHRRPPLWAHQAVEQLKLHRRHGGPARPVRPSFFVAASARATRRWQEEAERRSRYSTSHSWRQLRLARPAGPVQGQAAARPGRAGVLRGVGQPAAAAQVSRGSLQPTTMPAAASQQPGRR